MRCARPSGEDVKNQIGAVNDAAGEILLDITHLAGGELVIEDREGYFVCSDECSYLFDLPLVDKSARIGMFNTLQEFPDRHCTCSLGKKRQLVKVFTGAGFIYLRGDDPDQDSSFYNFNAPVFSGRGVKININ